MEVLKGQDYLGCIKPGVWLAGAEKKTSNVLVTVSMNDLPWCNIVR